MMYGVAGEGAINRHKKADIRRLFYWEVKNMFKVKLHGI